MLNRRCMFCDTHVLTQIAQRFEDWHATEKYQRSVELEDMREQRLRESVHLSSTSSIVLIILDA